MATIKTYTDLEQSKRLVGILPPESADMWYQYIGASHEVSSEKPLYYPMVIRDCETNKDIPCWSLAALINSLPSEFTTENKFGIFKYTIHIRKYKITENEDVYQIAYGNYKYYEDGSSSWKDMINTGEKEELLDAAFDMICWLKENEKI